MRKFPEEDWKILRELKNDLIEKFCEQTLDSIKSTIENRKGSRHQSYLQIWKILNKKDEELSDLFDDFKRSTAFFKLLSWRNSGLLDDKDFNKFSSETQNVIKALST